MNKLIKVIGSMVFAFIMYSIPVLATCSTLLKWNALYQLIFWISGASEFSALCFLVFNKVEVDE